MRLTLSRRSKAGRKVPTAVSRKLEDFALLSTRRTSGASLSSFPSSSRHTRESLYSLVLMGG